MSRSDYDRDAVVLLTSDTPGGRQARWARVFAAGAQITIVVFAQVGLVLAPSQLASRPMLVLALRPTPAFLMLISGAVLPVTAVAVASVGRTIVDVAYFNVARHGALPIAQRFGIGRNVARGVSRKATTRGLLTVLFFWSSTPVIAALGLGTVKTRTFVSVTGAGNVVTSAAFVFFGRRLSRQIAPVSDWLSTHSVQVTVTIVVVVGITVLVAMRRGRQA